MSLFNRMDGYDTFAHSEGIGRELIEGELSSVYANEPSKEEFAYIRANGLPTVYCQFATEDETVVQSAVSFLRSDYAGERSAYMVHSLLLSEEEKKERFCGPKAAAFNPSVFRTDLSGFDLTGADAKAITDLPELSIPVCDAGSPAHFAAEYDTGMVKRLIYALIGIPCGKTKTLFLAFKPKEDFSLEFVSFMNDILQIFPYSMRTSMSFVSSVSEQGKYSGFKIKGISEDFPNPPTAKGITLKMSSKDYNGISDENVAANASVVDFFYNLLTSENERVAFLKFFDYAVAHNESLRKINLKTLTDLVFLFRALSGFTEENTVLPNDDAVYAFIGVYDKNREVLTEEYRSRSMNCLKRYPESHQPIPKNVFAKVVKIYADEPALSRETVMNVALDLIHLDLMREKLFEFIKSSYSLENEETRAEIMQNLCRVYYGGFLQNELIGFFTERFESEPAEIRGTILERLLLTVRTPQVQQSVLGFIDRFYDVFSEKEKEQFYRVFFEMLPEADALSRLLADVVDAHAEETRKPQLAERIVAVADADRKSREPKLCGALATKCGFTESVLVKMIFGKWGDQKAVDTFCDCICEKSIPDRIETICEIWRIVPEMNFETSERLLNYLTAHFEEGPRSGLFELVDCEAKLEALKAEIPASESFVGALEERAIRPAASMQIPTCFDVRRYPDGITKLLSLSETCDYLRESPSFACVAEYRAMLNAAKSGNGADLFSHAAKLEGKNIRQGAAIQLKKDTDGTEKTTEQEFLIASAVSYLRADNIVFGDAANKVRDRFSRQIRAEQKDADPEKISQQADDCTMETVLEQGAVIYGSEIPIERKEKMLDMDSELAKQINTYLSKNEKKGKKFVTSAIEKMNVPEAYRNAVLKIAGGSSSGGFFKRLFGKS